MQRLPDKVDVVLTAPLQVLLQDLSRYDLPGRVIGVADDDGPHWLATGSSLGLLCIQLLAKARAWRQVHWLCMAPAPRLHALPASSLRFSPVSRGLIGSRQKQGAEVCRIQDEGHVLMLQVCTR